MVYEDRLQKSVMGVEVGLLALNAMVGALEIWEQFWVT